MKKVKILGLVNPQSENYRVFKEIIESMDNVIMAISGIGELGMVVNDFSPDILFIDLSEEEEQKIDGVNMSDIPSKVKILLSDELFRESLYDKFEHEGYFGFVFQPLQKEMFHKEIRTAVTNNASAVPEGDIEEAYQKLKEENEMLKVFNKELSTTNDHLVSATFRERDMKQKLAETLEELKRTKAIVEDQHKKISDSINYALRIQQALIPDQEELEHELGECGVFYKPKDVVSGDFPWFFKTENHKYIAVVDCTGHGVPGAMMSIIGSLLLTDILNDGEELTPAQVLNRLHKAVVKTLGQDKTGANAADGMDLALCRISNDGKEILFSGAHRPLYQLHNNEIIQIKGDKYPIGGTQYKGKNSFSDHEVDLGDGDALFLFSDGLPDQFGGPENLKFGNKKIRRCIQENDHLELPKLTSMIRDEFESWRNDAKQIDDVLLVGLRITNDKLKNGKHTHK